MQFIQFLHVWNCFGPAFFLDKWFNIWQGHWYVLFIGNLIIVEKELVLFFQMPMFAYQITGHRCQRLSAFIPITIEVQISINWFTSGWNYMQGVSKKKENRTIRIWYNKSLDLYKCKINDWYISFIIEIILSLHLRRTEYTYR